MRRYLAYTDEILKNNDLYPEENNTKSINEYPLNKEEKSNIQNSSSKDNISTNDTTKTKTRTMNNLHHQRILQHYLRTVLKMLACANTFLIQMKY